MSVATAPPDTQALEVKRSDLAARLDGLQIENVREVAPDVLIASLEGSALIGRLADDYVREVELSFGPLAKAAHEAHRKITAERDRLKAPAEALKREAGTLGHACNAEIQRRQREQEAAAERERQRLQAEADERARIEREAAQRAQDEATLEEAARLEQAGDAQAANRLIAAPPVVAPVVAAPVFVPRPAPIAPKVEAAPSFGETWGEYEVTDFAAIPREYLLVDAVKVRQVIKAMKGATHIPGIRVMDPRPRATFRKSA